MTDDRPSEESKPQENATKKSYDSMFARVGERLSALLGWGRKLLTLLAASSIVAIKGGTKVPDVEESGRKASGFRIGFIFKYILPSITALAVAYLPVSQLVFNYSTDIIVESLTIPDKFSALGISKTDDIVNRAIDSLPVRIAEYQRQFSGDNARLTQLPVPIDASQERYCPQARLDEIVRIHKDYFTLENQKTVRVSSDLEEVRFQWPGIERLTNSVRRFLGKEVIKLRLVALETPTGHELRVDIVPVSGYAGSGNVKTFKIRLIADPAGQGGRSIADALLDAVAEGLMRVAYPEATALAFGALGRTDLEVEQFVADRYPNQDRRRAIEFGLLKALLTRTNWLTQLDDWKRSTVLLKELTMPSAARYVLISEDQAVILQTRLKSLIVNIQIQAAEVSALFREAEVEWFKKLATKRRKKFDDILDNREADRRFDPVERRLVAGLFASSIFYATDFSELWRYQQWLLETVSIAKDAAGTATGDIRATLQDSILNYASLLNASAQQAVRTKEDIPADLTGLLRDYLEFHDRQLNEINDKWSLFDDNERALLETVAIAAQIWLGDTVDALSRAQRIATHAQPCVVIMLASQIYDHNSQWLVRKAAEKPEFLTPLLNASFNFLKRAESSGLRYFTLFNSLGTVAGYLNYYDSSIEAYSRAVLYTGERPWAYLNKGAEQLRNGDAPSAEISYRESLRVSVEDCLTDLRTWSDIDRRYNEAMGKAIERAVSVLKGSSSKDSQYLLINQECTRKGTGIPSAIFGLLGSLEIQNKAGEFLRAYQIYAADDIFAQKFPDQIKEAIEIIRRWNCNGIMNKLPRIPATMAEAFPLENGRFVCH